MFGLRFMRYSISALPITMLAIASVLLSGCASDDGQSSLLDVGDLISEVQFSDFEGTAFPRSEFENRVVVLNFWASWCAPCRKEMPSLQRLANTLNKDKFKVIGVSVDDDANLATEFLLQHDISFTNLHDPHQTLAINRFGITAYPETMIISADGKIVRKILGEQAWDSPGMISLLKRLSDKASSQTGSFAFGKE